MIFIVGAVMTVIVWYIVEVSFIGGGNQNTLRKPPTCGKFLTNLSHNVVSKGIRNHNVSGDRN
jgi:hypothetical protein